MLRLAAEPKRWMSVTAPLWARLLTAAAWSGLRPAPESRSRRAILHLWRSFSCSSQINSSLTSYCIAAAHCSAKMSHRPLDPSFRTFSSAPAHAKLDHYAWHSHCHGLPDSGSGVTTNSPTTTPGQGLGAAEGTSTLNYFASTRDGGSPQRKTPPSDRAQSRRS